MFITLSLIVHKNKIILNQKLLFQVF